MHKSNNNNSQPRGNDLNRYYLDSGTASNETTVHSTVASSKPFAVSPAGGMGGGTARQAATTPRLKIRGAGGAGSSEEGDAEEFDFEAGLKTSWPSVYMACVMGLISATQFTVYFTSLWPFMKVGVILKLKTPHVLL